MKYVSNKRDLSAVQRQLNVMHAVILRDIRSRYFNHGLGFLVVPMFPVAHMLLLLMIYKVMNRDAPFGDDLVLFFATGLIPTLTFNYISRFMTASVLANKNMLSFPEVHLLDIVLARSMLELLAAVIATVVMLVVVVLLGGNPSPYVLSQAALAMGLVIVASVGVGIMVSVISALFPMFAMGYSLFTAVIYLSAGGPIFIQAFPERVIYYCSFNPLFHAVEWMRTAYYLGYPTQYLDKLYLIEFAFGSLALGLLMERVLKTHVVNA